MKILVTGATGFIGSAFTKLASSRGHQVAGMMLPTESPPSHVPPSPNLIWLKGTLAEAPWREIERFQPEVCVHFAWVATPGVYFDSPDNEKFLAWSLDFLRRIRQLGAGHIVGVGTCVEYQASDKVLSEDRTPLESTTPYTRCKNALREALAADAARDGHLFCWGRIFYPYGPGEHPARLASSIIQKLGRNEKFALKTPNSTKDYIYIDDLAAAILLTVECRLAGTINWGTGVGVTVREVARTVAELLGKPQLVEEAAEPQPDAHGFVVADASRLRSQGWRPAVELREGLSRLVRHYTAA